MYYIIYILYYILYNYIHYIYMTVIYIYIYNMYIYIFIYVYFFPCLNLILWTWENIIFNMNWSSNIFVKRRPSQVKIAKKNNNIIHIWLCPKLRQKHRHNPPFSTRFSGGTPSKQPFAPWCPAHREPHPFGPSNSVRPCCAASPPLRWWWYKKIQTRKCSKRT